MQKDMASASKLAQAAVDDPWSAACAAAAKRYGIWVHSGSAPILGAQKRFRNEGGVYDPLGRERARYVKIHLFDVDLPGFPRYGSPTGMSRADRARCSRQTSAVGG